MFAVNLFCVKTVAYTLLLILEWWQELQPGLHKRGKRNLDAKYLETNFTLLSHGFPHLIHSFGNVIDQCYGMSRKFSPMTHMLKASLYGFMGEEIGSQELSIFKLLFKESGHFKRLKEMMHQITLIGISETMSQTKNIFSKLFCHTISWQWNLTQ